MKRLLKAAAALLCVFGLPFAQAQLTTITASSINMGGVPISAGTVTFTPVNSSGIPIAFATGGGGLNSPTAFGGTITVGAISGSFQVPDACLTSPANILYSIQITNTATQKSFTLQQVANVCGSTWALDQYGPPATTSNVQPVQAAYGTAAPPSSCVPASTYTQNASGGKFFTCIGGVFVQVSGGTVTYGTTAGTAAQGNDSRFAANAAAAAAAQATANAAVPAITLPSGDLAEYPFNDGTGTTVTDVSGNGNNATFGASTAAPTWYSYGVSFLDAGTASTPTQYVSTPLTTFHTAVIAFCSPTMVTNTGTATGGVPGDTYPTLVGSSNASKGIYWLASPATHQSQVSMYPQVYPIGSGGGSTESSSGFGGCHVYALTLDTLDHFFVDGHEVAGYAMQSTNSSVVTLTSGNYNIGTAQTTTSSNSLRGVVSYAIFWPTALTTAQVQQATSYVWQKLSLRPTFPKYPTFTTSRVAQFLAVGDSLTAGYRGTSQWSASTSFNNTYVTTNYGIGGITAFDVCNLADQRWVQSIVPGRTVINLWAGTNDFGDGFTANDVWNSLVTCAQTAKKYGARIILDTMISRTGNDTNKNALNALERSGYKKAGFDYLNDFAAVAALGQDNANTNTACFFTDDVHLIGPGAGTCDTVSGTALTGYGVVAALVSNAVNTLDGSSQSNPDVTTSNAFVETYANNYVIQTPTAAATHQLVDIQGQTSPRTIVNGSATNAITVSSTGSQTIVGSTTVAAGATAIFTPVLTGPTTGGQYWVRVQ